MKKGSKALALSLALAVALGLYMNTNQNPARLLDRIFPPMGGDHSVIYYGSIIGLIILYILLKKIYETVSIYYLNRPWKRILAIIIILSCLKPLQVDLIKRYRSWQTGVDALYLYRDQMHMETKIEEFSDEFVITVNGQIKLENLASNPTNFKMKVAVPAYYEAVLGGKWLDVYLKDGFTHTIDSHRQEYLNFSTVIEKNKTELQDIKNLDLGGESRSQFELKLSNESGEAYFEGDYLLKKDYAQKRR
ncbi:MAG: hypothetical protein AB9856_01735 [Cellulosilyticaceae bacterium]